MNYAIKDKSDKQTHVFSSVSIQKFSDYMKCNGVVRVIFQLQHGNKNQLQNNGKVGIL